MNRPLKTPTQYTIHNCTVADVVAEVQDGPTYKDAMRSMDIKTQILNPTPVNRLDEALKEQMIEKMPVKFGAKMLRTTAYVVSQSSVLAILYVSFGGKRLTLIRHGRLQDVGGFIYLQQADQDLTVSFKTRYTYYWGRHLSAVLAGLFLLIVPGLAILALIASCHWYHAWRIKRVIIPVVIGTFENRHASDA